ncbi:MAG: hypothetical protein M3Q55_02930 [Acidobacteriota bacterium]|nr:hypothetical protein [Acidobacteriota bacterium]
MRILSFHAAYACRHSGACCSAGWIEPLADGVCRHFDAHGAGRCTVHRAHGHDALPHACQQFPRVATLSPLGTSVTLSAFCPTAASLLFDDAAFTIETRDDPRAYEGLDARGVMPPLLRGGMLMDWESVACWEELTVATLSDHRQDVECALAIIEDASADVCETWTPAEGLLSDALEGAFRARASGASVATPSRDRRRDRSLARPQSGGAEDAPDVQASSAAKARYFASHAFACWPMYDGRGIPGAIDWLLKLRTALDEERRSQSLLDACRQTDLRLRHAVTSHP